MTVWAIVPVKPLQRAKSRLSKVLSRSERATLGRKLLKHTLEVLAQVPAVERTMVVSRDSEALALARDYDAKTVTERGSPPVKQSPCKGEFGCSRVWCNRSISSPSRFTIPDKRGC